MRIVVIPDLLEDRAQQMAQSAAQLYDIDGRLSRALGALDWEARQKANVEGLVNAARGRARDLAGEAERLARYLADRATAFRQADMQGTQLLEATTQKYHSAVQACLPSTRNSQVPDQHNAQRYAQLGNLLKGVELVGTVAVPLMKKKLPLSLLGKAALAFDVGVAVLSVPIYADMYASQGCTAVVSGVLVDSAIAIATKKLLAFGGAAIGGLFLGPLGAKAGYIIGGVFGILVADWLRKTPFQQTLRDAARQGLEFYRTDKSVAQVLDRTCQVLRIADKATNRSLDNAHQALKDASKAINQTVNSAQQVLKDTSKVINQSVDNFLNGFKKVTGT